MRILDIDIWSDVVCPWCAIGERRLKAALESFPHREAVRLRYRAFELDPRSPRQGPPVQEVLTRKYRLTPAQVQQMQERVAGLAAELGMRMDFHRTHMDSTFDAHRLIALAGAQGRGPAMAERLFTAYFGEGQRLGDPAALCALAEEVGVRGAAELLADPTLQAAQVRQDEANARELGVTGVPFFLFGGRLAVAGGQPVEVFQQALERAWAELSVELPDAETCGEGACPV
jgi:predicted DsbA family dithiol-disulfide isomerase